MNATLRNPYARKHVADEIRYFGADPATAHLFVDVQSAEEAEILRCPYCGDRAFMKPTVGAHICLGCDAIHVTFAQLPDGTRLGSAMSGEARAAGAFWREEWSYVGGTPRWAEDAADRAYERYCAAEYERSSK